MAARLTSCHKVAGRRCDIGASIIRIGFWAHYTILIRRNPQNSIGIFFLRPLYCLSLGSNRNPDGPAPTSFNRVLGF